MADGTTMEKTGAFTRDQAEILSARRGEPEWLREQRLRAYEAFVAMPMPTTQAEEWRYTDLRGVLDLDALALPEERRPVASEAELPEALRSLEDEAGAAAAHLVQVDGSVVFRDVPEELRAQGVIFTSLDQAVQEHPERVRERLGTAVTAGEGKFAALNAAFWTGGTFLYVPRDVRVRIPLRTFRWISAAGTAAFGRTLIVAEPFSEVVFVNELGSDDLDDTSLASGALEIFAGEGARVHYASVQRWGKGVVQLHTDRLVAGRDARITALYTALGADLARSDAQCRLEAPGAHVDMLGLYIAGGEQHFDHQTLQDHRAPHASSNLLFKGAIDGRSRSVFRGLIRVHPGAQRTDAYQTNRNLILSSEARADSLPNLEIGADDVRCSHAATVGQLDREELFYLMSRGIPEKEAVRLVIFGFFGEVLEQLEIEEIRTEMVRAIEHKLYGE